MLDIIFIILFLFNIILLLYSIPEKNLPLLLISAITWLILALFLLQGIEIPYEMFNATSGNIETGIHKIQTNLDPLAYLLMALGLVTFIIFASFTIETMYDYNKIRRG
jgi:formate hydrogenlyase subunit 3/multisubunit Na+/H+ antiporter MnhD subunit